MGAVETETVAFDCPKLHETVYVRLNYLTRNGNRLGAVDVGNCDGARQCGVGTPSGHLDWSKCVHEHARKGR